MIVDLIREEIGAPIDGGRNDVRRRLAEITALARTGLVRKFCARACSTLRPRAAGIRRISLRHIARDIRQDLQLGHYRTRSENNLMPNSAAGVRSND